MGRKVKKALYVLLAVLFMAVPVSANTITYTYGNSVSSSDFDEIPNRGQIYVDGNSNILIVKAIYDDVLAFDKLISVAPYERGSTLTARQNLKTASVFADFDHALVSYTFTTPFYPFAPVAFAGLSYGRTFGIRGLVLAGVKVTANVANLWDSLNTFIENGKITGWAAAGISISSPVTIAASYGFSYRHSLGFFSWELGWSWLAIPSVAVKGSPYLGVGMEY